MVGHPAQSSKKQKFTCVYFCRNRKDIEKAFTHVGSCSTWEILRRFTDRVLENLKALAISGGRIVPEFAAVQNRWKDYGFV